MKKAGLEVATESTLMFPEMPEFTAAQLIDVLSPLLSGDHIDLLKDEAAGRNRYMTLQAGGCIVGIEAVNDVRPAAAYFEALDWPLLHLSFPDAETVVRNHTAHVHISVEIEFDPMANALGLKPQNTTYARSLLNARVAEAVSRLAMPGAIHWKSSAMLHMPERFSRDLEADPASLFVRITPFSSNRQVGGVRLIGASTRGAAPILGREIVLEEAPLPAEWAQSMMKAFISQCHADGEILSHLTTFCPSPGDILVVRHMKSTPEIAMEHISLEVRKAEEHDYDASFSAYQRAPEPDPEQKWDGVERRNRPRTAKAFGRRGLG